jgi:hypothetical protein
MTKGKNILEIMYGRKKKEKATPLEAAFSCSDKKSVIQFLLLITI